MNSLKFPIWVTCLFFLSFTSAYGQITDPDFLSSKGVYEIDGSMGRPGGHQPVHPVQKPGTKPKQPFPWPNKYPPNPKPRTVKLPEPAKCPSKIPQSVIDAINKAQKILDRISNTQCISKGALKGRLVEGLLKEAADAGLKEGMKRCLIGALSLGCVIDDVCLAFSSPIHGGIDGSEDDELMKIRCKQLSEPEEDPTAELDICERCLFDLLSMQLDLNELQKVIEDLWKDLFYKQNNPVMYSDDDVVKAREAIAYAEKQRWLLQRDIDFKTMQCNAICDDIEIEIGDIEEILKDIMGKE